MHICPDEFVVLVLFVNVMREGLALALYFLRSVTERFM